MNESKTICVSEWIWEIGDCAYERKGNADVQYVLNSTANTDEVAPKTQI